MATKPTYSRRTNTHGDILYFRDGQPITEREFNRAIPACKAYEQRMGSSMGRARKQTQAQIDAEDLALLEKIQAKLKYKP